MDVQRWQEKRNETAQNLADVLSEFNAADEEYRSAMRRWNESNAQEGSAMWKKLEKAVDDLFEPRWKAARCVVNMIEQIAMVEHSVSSTRETTG